MRLDTLVFQRGLCESRTRAAAYIRDGRVTVDGAVVRKPSFDAPEDAAVTLDPTAPALVSRAQQKLDAAMARLAPEPEAGWLPALYAWLDNGLFPDPAYQAPPEAPVLAALAELLDGVLACEDAPFDMLTDLAAHGPEDGSRVADELPAFHAALHASHFVTMLRIGRELLPFDAASHTIGVHNIATLTAQCAKEAGLPVDVPLVSAAALCHDIGKFGCRGADAKRIPYLHYYYTWQRPMR